jgi:hypothetical protein
LCDGDVEQLYPDARTDQIRHLAGRNPGSDLDQPDLVVTRDELREGDAVPQAEHADGLERDLLRAGEHLVVERRREEMNPADTEASTARAETVREGHEHRLSAADDQDAVQLGSFDVLLNHGAPARREPERLGETALDVVLGADQEDSSLTTGVSRLEDGGQRQSLEHGGDVHARPEDGKARLRDAGLGKQPAHRRFVGHRARNVHADARQAEHVRDDRRRHHGTIARHREDTVDAMLRRRRHDLLEVREIDIDGNVRDVEADRAGVAVHRDDAVTDCLGVPDRGDLRDARAQEEKRRHALRRYPRHGAPAGTVQGVFRPNSGRTALDNRALRCLRQFVSWDQHGPAGPAGLESGAQA